MSTERRPDARLREHADRLLTGTGLTLDAATELAADPTAPAPANGGSAAAALREGWTLADATTTAATAYATTNATRDATADATDLAGPTP
jgi:hypothetical protein